MVMRDNFLFNLSWREAVRELPNDVRLEIYEGIMDYVATGEVPALKSIAAAAFGFIKQDVDNQVRKYREKCAKNAENIKKRWGDNTNVYDRIQPNTSAYEPILLEKEKEKEKDNNISPLSTNVDVPPLGADGQKKTKRFVRPSLQEIEAYCRERNNRVDARVFYDFYESKGWVVGKSPMKDWKAAVRTWERGRDEPRPRSQLPSQIDEVFRQNEETLARLDERFKGVRLEYTEEYKRKIQEQQKRQLAQ